MCSQHSPIVADGRQGSLQLLQCFMLDRMQRWGDHHYDRQLQPFNAEVSSK